MIDFSGHNVLVAVAHPDDETIGCGGTISRLVSLGCSVKVLMPFRGCLERSVEQWRQRLSALEKACLLLGAQALVPPDPIPEEMAEQRIADISASLTEHVSWADVVFTHWINDTHQTHRALSRAVEIATRPFRTHKHTVLFETPSSTDQGFFASFCPNLYVKLAEADLRKKMDAMEIYVDQMAPGRFTTDLENYARYRGSQIGVAAAEAFFVTRSFY